MQVTKVMGKLDKVEERVEEGEAGYNDEETDS